jgi:hypothetical protein
MPDRPGHLRRTLFWAVCAAALGVIFAAYLDPDIMLALDGFWAMCTAALR